MKRKLKIAIGITALGLVGGLGFWGIPRLISKNISRNEHSAIAFLKNLSSSQAQVQAIGAIDANGDGAGEYGFLGEMTGEVNLPGSEEPLSPPVLGRNRLRHIGDGVFAMHGYLIRIYLPGAKTPAIWEHSHPASNSRSLVDPDLSARIWWCVAWPAWHGISGRRMFVVNQAGDVLSSGNHVKRYSGMGNMPATGFSSPPEVDESKPWTSTVNEYSRDGSRWTVV